MQRDRFHGGSAVAAIGDITGAAVIAGAGAGEAVTDVGCTGERPPGDKIDIDTAAT